MYLSSDQIEKLLADNGLDITETYGVQVSNEYDARKDTGELFQLVFEKFDFDVHNAIHIGDKSGSDFLGAYPLTRQERCLPESLLW